MVLMLRFHRGAGWSFSEFETANSRSETSRNDIRLDIQCQVFILPWVVTENVNFTKDCKIIPRLYKLLSVCA